MAASVFCKIKLCFIHFFYKQLTLGWKIAKQLSGLNPLSLSNDKNFKMKWSFFFNKHKIAAQTTVHQNSAASKALLGKFYNHWFGQKYRF